MAMKQENFLKNYISSLFKGKIKEDEDSDEEDHRVRFKHNPINNNSSLNMVNYLASAHHKSLQHSPYIKYESDTDQIIKHTNMLKKASINRENLGINHQQDKKMEMFLRYCKEEEVIQKNQIFLMFKGTFLAKLKMIESNSQNMVLTGKLQSWIDQNFEKLYDKMIIDYNIA